MIILLYSLASVLPLVAATGLVAGGILYWVQNYAFLLIVLGGALLRFPPGGQERVTARRGTAAGLQRAGRPPAPMRKNFMRLCA